MATAVYGLREVRVPTHLRIALPGNWVNLLRPRVPRAVCEYIGEAEPIQDRGEQQYAVPNGDGVPVVMATVEQIHWPEPYRERWKYERHQGKRWGRIAFSCCQTFGLVNAGYRSLVTTATHLLL